MVTLPEIAVAYPKTKPEIEIAEEHRRMTRFVQSALGLLTMIWISICLLIYYHAPSYQIEQLYDCRWHLSSLAICAGFGYLFTNHSQTTFTFIAALISSQYAAVYSLLSLVVYTLDTFLIVIFPRSTLSAAESAPYLKLTSLMIVLSVFGTGFTIAHAHRLLLIVWWQPTSSGGISSSSAATLSNGRVSGNSRRDDDRSKSLGAQSRTINLITTFQAVLAVISIYSAISLLPLRLWYVRLYTVQECSCAILAFSVSFLQFIVLRKNGAPSHPQLLIKAVVVANACQFVQELNMAISAFYSIFYVGRAAPLLVWQLRQQLMAQASGGTAVTPADPKITLRQMTIGLNLLIHFVRMAFALFVAWHFSKRVFSSQLLLRVKRHVDSQLVNAATTLAQLRHREKKWLNSILVSVFIMAAGHVILNLAYLMSGLLYETMSTATGLAFVFSVLLAVSIAVYTAKQFHIALVLSAYLALNLMVTSCLLLFSFLQDLLYAASIWQTSAADLDDAPNTVEIETGSSTAEDTDESPSSSFNNSSGTGEEAAAAMEGAAETATTISSLFGQLGENSNSTTIMNALMMGEEERRTTAGVELEPTFSMSTTESTTTLASQILETATAQSLSSANSSDGVVEYWWSPTDARVMLYCGDLLISVITFAVAISALRYAIRQLIASRHLQTQPSGVQYAIKLLHAISFASLIGVAFEFLLLVELQIENKHSAHLSMNSNVYDWLLTAAQAVFMCYATRHERFQALLVVQVLQLTSVSLTTLDLLAQQTEIVQVYLRSVLQFYHITEAIMRHGAAFAAAATAASLTRKTGVGGGNSSSMATTGGMLGRHRTSPAVSMTHAIALPLVTVSIPLHLFVDVLALHIIQIIQWFLTVFALGLSIYAYDNLVEDEQDNSNDFHELNPTNQGNTQQLNGNGNPSSTSLEANGGGGGSAMSFTNPLMANGINSSKMNGHASNNKPAGLSSSSFENRTYSGMEDRHQENGSKAAPAVSEREDEIDGYKTVDLK